MSNNAIGHAIAKMLRNLEDKGVLDRMPKEDATYLMELISVVIENEDGTPSEALEGISYKYGVCACCGEAVEEFVDGEHCSGCARFYKGRV